MPRARVLAFAFLILASLSAPPSSATPAPDRLQTPAPFGLGAARPRLALGLVDFAGLPAEALASLREETAALTASLGVDADLVALPPGAVLEARAVTLILMNGGAPTPLKPGVMGAAQREGTTRALWIYSAGVAAGARLDWGRRNRWTGRERRVFATALARVAVHEIVHVVCPWRAHDDEGLMAGTLDSAALTGVSIPVSFELGRAFAAGVDALAGGSVALVRTGAWRDR